jgi:hypothetical protein
MENLKVTLSQNYTNSQGIELGEQITIKVPYINSEATSEDIVGTILSEFFSFIDLQKKVGSKALKLSQPILLTLENTDIKIIDLCQLDIKIQQRLKLNSKAKSKRAFAFRVVASIEYLIRERKLTNINELIAQLREQEAQGL